MIDRWKKLNLSVIWTPLTWMFVLINAFPIVWMVWCSLMGNNEILQGKTLPDRQRNDVFYIDSVPGIGLLAGTVNGQIYALQQDKRLDLGQISTSYYRDAGMLWVLSADGGLNAIDLAHWSVVEHFDWDWMGTHFQEADQTEFILKPGMETLAGIDLLASRLNSKSLVNGNEGISMAAVTGIHFPANSSLIDSLNRLMLDPVLLAKVIQEWSASSDWFNPVIPWLMKQERTPLQQRELFRWCLSERFPGEISRFLQPSWNDIWVNRIPGSGNGTSVVGCGDGLICYSLWWDEFPGIGILDPSRKTVNWITMQHGLPSTSIQHLLHVSTNEILAISDAGLSLVNTRSMRVTKNFLYGEYGLKYLDGRDVRAAQVDSSHILISYGQEVMYFNFREGEGRTLETTFLRDIASDITALTIEAGSVYLGTSQGVYVRDISLWLGGDTIASAKIPVMHYKDLFQQDGGRIEDAVVHSIQVSGSHMNLGGLFGSVSSVNLLTHHSDMRKQVPEGRFSLHWRNYEDLWKTIPFGLFLRNSLVICLSVMFISMFVSSLASYALARFEFPGKRLFGAAILATQMVPGILYLIPIFVVFTAIQQYAMIEMVNTWHGIILVYSAFFIPMSTWILRSFFANIPKELEEAALIDGCSPLGAFIRITLPAALPGIIATGIYVFLLSWDELMFAWVLCTDTSTATIPVGIRLYVGQFGNRFDLLMAAASVATLPVMVLFFLMQKHIVTGLTGGAVKG